MSMRKIREVLRLTHELGLSVRQVREATGVGKTAVCEYVSRARVIGITWPIPPEISDAELERGCSRRRAFRGPDQAAAGLDEGARGTQASRRDADDPVGGASRRAVRRPRIFPVLELYGEWRRCLSPTMRQTHVAGDKLFVDWAGDTVPIIDPMTGEVHEAHYSSRQWVHPATPIVRGA